MAVQIVQGYVYSNDFDKKRNGKVCTILSRADPDPYLDMEPKFVVEFEDGDGERFEVLGELLHPWFSS